ncbi:protein FAM107B-like isoform X2 [Hemicordylus capensis]|uniref:protein FAM107B-like isoform X2 n=1 Tax=Hemicordylus capensis TaxID=884348 RepID=UPI002304C8CD|nr:protein FAM107B-like isoform X2 [Hemicordylus capensis]
MGSNTFAAARSETRGPEAQLATSRVPNPTKVSWNQQQLHKELLFTHRKGLSLRSKPELLQVLELRSRRRDKTENSLEQTPLEKELMRWQQRREQRQQQEATGETVGKQPEFIRVRENLRRTHQSRDVPPQRATPSPISSPSLRSHFSNRRPLKVPAMLSPVIPQAEASQLHSSLEASNFSSASSQYPLSST